LRGGATDEDLRHAIVAIVLEKEEGHRINTPDFLAPARTMVYIGG
jgi:hypothetical protein